MTFLFSLTSPKMTTNKGIIEFPQIALKSVQFVCFPKNSTQTLPQFDSVTLLTLLSVVRNSNLSLSPGFRLFHENSCLVIPDTCWKFWRASGLFIWSVVFGPDFLDFTFFALFGHFSKSECIVIPNTIVLVLPVISLRSLFFCAGVWV